MNKIKFFALALVAAAAFAFTSCERPVESGLNFSVTYNGAEIKSGDVITVEEPNEVGEMPISVVLTNKSAKTITDFYVIEERDMDLEKYGSTVCVAGNCNPCNGNAMQTTSFDLKEKETVDLHFVPSHYSPDTAMEGTVVYTFGENEHDLTFTVKFVYTPKK